MLRKIMNGYLAAGLIAFGMSGPGWSQNEDDPTERELDQARRAVAANERDLAEARRRLEEAAREVARLSAEIAGPAARDFARDFDRGWRRLGGRARLGVNIEDAEEGVRVVGVTPGSGAADAGIVTGDVIVALDGAALTESGDRSPSEVLMAAMRDVDPDEGVLVRVLRDGEVEELTVLPQAAGPGSFVWNGRGTDFTMRDFGDLPRIFTMRGVFSRPFRELELVSLTPALGAYFGTDEGLLVVRAPENDQLELRDGDVILDIGGRTPNSPEHAMRILASFEPGETLRLSIMREQRRETLEFTLPEN